MEASFSLCSAHKTNELSYCSNCKTIVCEDCIQGHNAHNILTLNSLAADYKTCIQKFKGELFENIHKNIMSFKDYKKEVNRDIEVVITNLEKQIALLLKELHDHFQREREGIDNLCESIVKRFEDQEQCEEFNEDLEIIDKVIANTDKYTIQQITNKSLNDKYENKKSIIEKLNKEIDLVKIRVQNLINDYKDKERLLSFDSQYSFYYLSEIQLNEIIKIKEYEQALQVLAAEMLAIKEQSNKLKEEIKMLIQEQATLQEHTHSLYKENEMLKESVTASINKITELEQGAVGLIKETKRIQSEIKSLELLKKTKEELLIKVSDDLNKKLAQEPNKTDITAITFKEIDELNNASVLYVYETNFQVLIVYNFNMEKSVSIDAKDYGMVSNYGAVQVRNDFYAAGGFDTATVKFSRRLIKISFINFEEIKKESKKDMILGKSQHKLIQLDRKTLYSLGGKSRNANYVAECERYDIEEDKWNPAPNLNEAKLNVAATSFNHVLIYAFGGNRGKISNLVERLDARDLSLGWKVLKFNGAVNAVAREEAGCFQISTDWILIFGGIESSTGCTDEVFIMDVVRNEITKHKNKLCKKEWFAMRTPIRIAEGLIFTIGNFGLDLHVYDKVSMGWGMIEETSWIDLSKTQ